MIEPDISLSSLLTEWYGDPEAFVLDVFGDIWQPPHGDGDDDWQREPLRAIRDGHRRVAIRSGHGVGKSAFLALVTLWFATTRSPEEGFRCCITGSNYTQVKATLWAEIKAWRDKMPNYLKQRIEMTSEKLYIKGYEDTAFALLRTATREQAQNLAGFHHPHNVLIIIDEASAVPSEVFTVLRGALTTPGALFLVTGNPEQASGSFYDMFNKLAQFNWTLAVNAERVARVPREWVEEMAALYGRESNVYRVRVQGEFPLSDDTAVCPWDLLIAAKGRQVRALDVRPVWGLDVAYQGSDRSALVKRQGNVVLEPPKWWRGLDPGELARMVDHEYHATPIDMQPELINIDVIGIGAGVYADCKRFGLPVAAVNVAETKALLPASVGARLRDELWWRTRMWLTARDCSIPDQGCDALIAELSIPRYEERNGRIHVESTEDIKARNANVSPDLASALTLTFARLAESSRSVATIEYGRSRAALRARAYAAEIPGVFD